MQDIIINGTGKVTGGEYGCVSVNGAASGSGDIKAESVHIDGAFKTSGSIHTGKLDCNGSTKIDGNLVAQKMDVDGLVVVRGDRMEAEEIVCDGLIEASGQVSADRIRADGCIRAKEIVGDSVAIKSSMGKIVKFFKKNSVAELVEATTIELRGVTAKTVNGRDIVIGAGCEIETVDCSGTLEVDPKAVVGNITGDYQKK